MQDRPAIVTDADMERLTRLLRAFRQSLFRDQQQLEMLDQTLAAAEVRPLGQVPKDVIGMHSRVRVFDFDTRGRGLFTLVFPDEANISKGLISILAPLGIALLGRRKGDELEAQVPGGVRKLRVEGVQQQSGLSRAKLCKDRGASRSHPARSHENTLAA